jgi:hypothetical protein
VRPSAALLVRVLAGVAPAAGLAACPPSALEGVAPTPGELTYIQLGMPSEPFLPTGESAIIVGPDGTLVLVDVGSADHADNVRDAVWELNTRLLTPTRGYTARQPLQVDWLVVTHFHVDHVGAVPRLADGADALTGLKGIVHRGYVDVGRSLSGPDYHQFCLRARGGWAARDVTLCQAEVEAPCAPWDFNGPHPATGCRGLLQGSLDHPRPGAGPTSIPLGHGSRLTFLAANGHVVSGTDTVGMEGIGHAVDNQENARNLVSLLSHGLFRALLAGDLTGAGGEIVPDVESHVVNHLTGTYLGPRGVDVAHASHHARRTSSNATWVDALAPRDGRSRNVVTGITPLFAGSPHRDVLSRWLDGGRLGDGFLWATHVAVGGSRHPRLRNAMGSVVIQTALQGRRYAVFSSRDPAGAAWYRSVHAEE